MKKELKKIRISEKEYNDLVEKGKAIYKETEDPYSREYKKKFFQKNQFPTITELGEHQVVYRLREFLPYLIFYYEVYESDDIAFQNTYKLLDDIFTQLVVKISYEDLKKIEEINPTYFKKMDIDEKTESLEPLMDYYDLKEFNEFLEDLEWKNFMLAYGYKKSDYKKGKRNIKMEDDLREIWKYSKEY